MTQRNLSSAVPLLGLVAWFGLAACSSEDAEQPVQVPSPFQQFAERFELERQQLGIPGAAVAILQHGELVFAQGFGTKGIDSTEPVNQKTIFRTGSMGKVVTAIAAMSAVDDGKLDLDAPVRDAIPNLSLESEESDSLTMRHLLSQQTGLSDYIDFFGPSEDAALQEFCTGPGLSESTGFVNPPGLFWNYSNPNFYIAGCAIEATSGQPYREAIRSRVFEPLGMRRSFFRGSDVISAGDYSHGYGVVSATGEGELQDIAPDAYENAWLRPAGLGFSTVLDWARLMQFLMRGDPNVLSAAAHREVVSPQISTHTIYSDLKTTALGLADDYGLGLGVGSGFFMDHRAEPNTYYEMPFLGHGGDVPGFASTFIVFPSTGFGMVVLSNRDAERPIASMRLAMESFGGLPAPSAAPKGREVDPTRFSGYAGSYTGPEGTELSIRHEAGELSVSGSMIEATGLQYDPVLEATSLDNFALWITLQGERVPLEITFFPDESGQYAWFRSRIAVGRRVPDPNLP